jgi:hypothetical protein
MEEQINDLVGTYAEEWKLKDRQVSCLTCTEKTHMDVFPVHYYVANSSSVCLC